MKHYILGKRSVHIAVAALVAESLLILFIGSNNVYITQANRDLESKLDVQKAKAHYWEGRFKELIQSGTCLERNPKIETS